MVIIIILVIVSVVLFWLICIEGIFDGYMEIDEGG